MDDDFHSVWTTTNTNTDNSANNNNNNSPVLATNHFEFRDSYSNIAENSTTRDWSWNNDSGNDDWNNSNLEQNYAAETRHDQSVHQPVPDNETHTLTPSPALFDPLQNMNLNQSINLSDNPSDNDPIDNINNLLYQFDVTVSNPQKVGRDLINAHVVYQVSTTTNCPDYTSQTFSVPRRYSDFLWLYSTLIQSHPGLILPAPPSKQSIGRFDPEFIEARRAALDRFLKKTVACVWVQRDQSLRLFLESLTFRADKTDNTTTSFLNLFTSTPTNSTSTTATFIPASTLTSTNIATAASTPSARIVDDTVLERRRAQIENNDEAQFRGLLKALDGLVKQRRDVGSGSFEFGESLVKLSEIESGKNISRNLSTVGEIQKQLKALYDKQATLEITTLATTVEEYLRTIGSIRVAFAARMRAFTTWQGADLALKKKREFIERMRGGSDSRTRGEDIAAVVDNVLPNLESAAKSAFAELNRITELLYSELDRYNQERVVDFTAAVKDVLKSFLETQKQIVALWESYYTLTGQEIPTAKVA